MAGRMIRVISAHVSQDVEKLYGVRGDSVKQFTYWKRAIRKRVEPRHIRDERNCFTQEHVFFMFFMMLGNGYDGLPQSMRFALMVSGGLYMLYELLFSLMFTFPVLYTEMFLGRYSGLTNSQMYRMMPISFGICVLRLFKDVLFASIRSTSIAMGLMGALKNLLYIDLYCPNNPICYDYKKDNTDMGNCTMMHLMLECDGHKRLLVNAYYYWEEFRNADNFRANWSLIVGVLVTWIFILIVINLKMRIVEMLLKIFIIITFLMHLVLFLLAVTAEGAEIALQSLVEFKLMSIQIHTFILSAFFIPVKHHAIYGGGFMTYAASTNYVPRFSLTTTTMLLLFANYATNIFFMMVFHAILGVIGKRTGIDYKEVFFPFDGMYYVVVSEFLRSMNCPHIFISIYHLSTWMLECTKLTIIICMHINTLNDFFPSIVQFRIHSRIAWVGACSFLGLVNTMGVCVKYLNNTLWMANLYMMHSFQLFILSLLLFYGYGVSRLNDDIHFFTGKRPVKFWRIVWYMYPMVTIILIVTLAINQWHSEEQTLFIARDFLRVELVMTSFAYICIIMSSIIFIGMFIISFLYVVLQMRASMTIALTTPLFHWGPMKKEDRMARKAFTPRVFIRSQQPKKYRQRFRKLSVRQQHERDIAEHVKRGRLFLDKQFFINLGMRYIKTRPFTRTKSKYSRYGDDDKYVMARARK